MWWVFTLCEYPTRRSAKIICNIPQECRGLPTTCRVQVLGGELRAYFLAAEFVKCVGFSRVIRPQEPGFITNKQGEFFCKLVEVCGSCYESSSEVSYYPLKFPFGIQFSLTRAVCW